MIVFPTDFCSSIFILVYVFSIVLLIIPIMCKTTLSVHALILTWDIMATTAWGTCTLCTPLFKRQAHRNYTICRDINQSQAKNLTSVRRNVVFSICCEIFDSLTLNLFSVRPHSVLISVGKSYLVLRRTLRSIGF